MLHSLFSSDGFMPHGHCYLWKPGLIWLHVVSDALIALSYTSIPFTLFYFVRKRRDVPFHGIFLCFGLFIISCGATHVMEIWTLWTPTYWLSGVIKAITAAASVPTALLLVSLVPRALAIPTPSQLARANEELQKIRGDLEDRVRARTAELLEKNLLLAKEIEERQRAEEAQRTSDALFVQMRKERAADARFRALLEAAPDAMVIVDDAGRIVLVNAQAEKLFGYERAALLGQSLELLVVEHPAPTSSEPAEKTETSDLRGRRKDGSELYIEIARSPLETDEGIWTSNAIRDITARKRTETALRIANGELESFSYSVAHDLRAPLRAMNGLAQILLEDHLPELGTEGMDNLRHIQANAILMSELIDGLLSLSRVTRELLCPEPTDLSSLVRAALTRLAAEEPHRTIEITVQDGLIAKIDPALGRTLIENLIGNAWKFTGKTTAAHIEFGADLTKDVQTFFVRDNGAGFDMAYLAKLFAVFQRLHGDEFVGTGIGLATCRRIVERHGGRLWAEGAVNRGATFFFTLSGASSVS